MLKTAKILALAGAFLALTASPMFAAETDSVATFKVKMEKDAELTEIQTVINEEITNDKIGFNIINNTNDAIYFVSDDTENIYIPIISQRTVVVPFTSFDEEYKVIDGQGNILAAWKMQPALADGTQIASADQAKFDEWGRTLQSLIQSNQVTAVNTQVQAEPTYSNTTFTQTTTERNTTVRGFW